MSSLKILPTMQLHHNGQERSAARQTLLPRSRLRRGPLVDLPLEGLRTGNSLHCVGWRSGKSWFLTDRQYRHFTDFLRAHFRIVAIIEEPDPEEDGESDASDDVLSNSVWAYGSAEAFNPIDWIIRSWGWWENPIDPQPPPEPFPGGDKYYGVVGLGSWRGIVFIPSLKKRTAAKKDKNLVRFANEKRRLCAERKAQFKHWNKKLRETLGSHSNSHNGGCYETENCPRCGASVFTKKPRVCLDCGYTLGELPLPTQKTGPAMLRRSDGYAPSPRDYSGTQSKTAEALDPRAVRCGLNSPWAARGSDGYSVPGKNGRHIPNPL